MKSIITNIEDKWDSAKYTTGETVLVFRTIKGSEEAELNKRPRPGTVTSRIVKAGSPRYTVQWKSGKEWDNIRARCMRPVNYKWTPDAEANPSDRFPRSTEPTLAPLLRIKPPTQWRRSFSPQPYSPQTFGVDTTALKAELELTKKQANNREIELRQQIADLQDQLDCSRKVTKTFAEKKFQAQNEAKEQYLKALNHLATQHEEVEQLKDLLEGARKQVSDLSHQLATLREIPEHERLMELVQLELTVFQSRIMREVQENRDVMNKHFTNANQAGACNETPDRLSSICGRLENDATQLILQENSRLTKQISDLEAKIESNRPTRSASHPVKMDPWKTVAAPVAGPLPGRTFGQARKQTA